MALVSLIVLKGGALQTSVSSYSTVYFAFSYVLLLLLYFLHVGPYSICLGVGDNCTTEYYWRLGIITTELFSSLGMFF